MAALAFGPKGEHLVTAGTDGIVRIHDARDLRPLHVFEAQSDWLHAVAWSAADGTIASGCDDGTVTWFDPASRKRLRSIRHEGRRASDRLVWSLAFDASGRTLFGATGDGGLQAWDARTGKLRYRIDDAHEGRALRVCLAPDGARIATSGDDGKAVIWDLEDRKAVRRLGGHAKGVFAMAWHPRRPWLATGDAGGTVRIWHAGTGRLLHAVRPRAGAIYGLDFDDTGRRLAVAAESGGLWVLAPRARR